MHADNPVALGAKRTASNLTSLPQMCILCQEEQDVTHTGRSLVLCAYVQRYIDTCSSNKYVVQSPENGR